MLALLNLGFNENLSYVFSYEILQVYKHLSFKNTSWAFIILVAWENFEF